MSIKYMAEEYEEEFGERAPMRWIICPTCDGDGTRALHGYDVTDMCQEDPDFLDGYMAGHYDTPCPDCRCEGKIKEFDTSRMTQDQERWVQRRSREEAEYLAEMEAERRAGC